MTAVLSSMTVRSTALIRGVTIAVRATRSPRGVRAMIETERGAVLYDAIYTPEVVMARVGHLRPDEQRKVELVARIIRSRFDPGAMIEPRPRISRIMLVPPESRPAKRPPDYEVWIILTDRLFTRQIGRAHVCTPVTNAPL